MAGIPSRVESPNAYAAPTAPLAAGTRNSYFGALSVLTTLFFMWGGLTSLNDVLIPHLKGIFSLNYFQAMLVQFCFFGAYGLMSIPAGRFVKTIGFKKGIIVGLGGAALGCLMFFPAAAVRSYGVFLFAFFVLATGIVILQVAANPFVAVLGKPETASSRLTLTQAFNSLATWAFPTFIGPIILAIAGLSAAELAKLTPAAQQAQEAQAVQLPYVGLALALAFLSVIVWRSKLPKVDTSDTASTADGAGAFSDRRSAWQYRHLVLGAVAIFMYVGAEVAIGSLLVNYFKEPYTLGWPESKGTRLMPIYWLCAMVGRFIGSGTLRLFKPGRLLATHAVVAALLAVTSALTSGWTAVIAIIAVGLVNSIMFPTIFTLAINGLGRHTEQGSGILCAAIVGGAFIPALQGVFADSAGLHISFILPAACYLYIAWYGLRGHATDAKAAVRASS
ncbi:MAG TPA: sugar MFS transporter [Polyangia bacterium]|jgi:FHS family L-fucose permease-like MFS transporter